MDLQNIIKEAKRQATKTEFHFRLGAVIFNNDRIISAGYNRAFLSRKARVHCNCAETLAIIKAPHSLLKGSTILVCRLRRSGSVGMAKPCKRCETLIKKAGIKRVIYSTAEGWETYVNRS